MSRNFRVEIKDFNNKTIKYEYFDTEQEAKVWCINRSEYYLRSMNAYECQDDHNILYQIQFYGVSNKEWIPDYSIAFNHTEFCV